VFSTSGKFPLTEHENFVFFLFMFFIFTVFSWGAAAMQYSFARKRFQESAT